MLWMPITATSAGSSHERNSKGSVRRPSPILIKEVVLVSQLWNLLLQAMVNSLLFLYDVLAHNFALSITVFTVLVRLLTLPMTLPAQR